MVSGHLQRENPLLLRRGFGAMPLRRGLMRRPWEWKTPWMTGASSARPSQAELRGLHALPMARRFVATLLPRLARIAAVGFDIGFDIRRRVD